MTTTTQIITADDLLAMPHHGRCELIRGEIINMSPAGFGHGDIAMQLAWIIKSYVKKHRLGKVLAAETGFKLERNPDTVRAPDVGFVSKKRIPDGSYIRGFFEGAPDLAIEVLSTYDQQTEVRAKVEQWLSSGAVSVWVVDPTNKSIDVYRQGRQVLLYRSSDTLTDEPTLPGFSIAISEFFSSD